MASGAYNPLGTGPQGFTPDPQSHAGPSTSSINPVKGGIQESQLPPDKADKPWGERFEDYTKKCWPSLRTAYTIFHQLVWQDLLFYVGQLWIRWDTGRRLYYPAEAEDEYTPMPNVNYYAPAADSVASIFAIPKVEAVPKNRRHANEDVYDILEVANVLAQEFAERNGWYSASKEGEPSVSDRASQLFVQSGNIFGFTLKRKRGQYDRPVIQTIPMTGVRCATCDTVSKVEPDDPMLQPPPPAPSDMLMGEQVNGPGMGGQPSFQPSCPTCQNPLDVYPTTSQKAQTDPETGQPVTQPVIQWDAEFKLGNPLYGLPQAGAKSMKQARYFMWAERMTIDEVFEETGADVQPDNQFLDSMESSYEIALNYFYTGFSNMTEASKDSCLALRMFIPPGKVRDVPEGGVGILIADRMIDLKTWEDVSPAGDHPVTHGYYLDVPVTFFGRSVMFDVANDQKELNRYESLIALHGMTQSSDSVVVDENSKSTEITGRGDRVVYWRSIGPGGQPPHRMQHGSLDAGIYEKHQQLRDHIQTITGAVNVFRGEQAGSVTAAGAISQLRGQAEQTFSKPMQNWNKFWAESARKGVRIMQKVMTVQDIIAILGPSSIMKAQKFMSANLDQMVDWKAGGKGMPRTRDERKEEMLSLFDRQMLDVTDPNVQEEVHDLFGETGMKTMFTKDATRARWENERMKQGQPVQFMPDVEDLNVHAFIHAEAIKELDFDLLPPPVQTMMLEHFMVTKQTITQQLMMQMEAQTVAGEKSAVAKKGEDPDAAPGHPSGSGAPSGGNGGGPGSKGGPDHGTPGQAGGKTFQSAGQRKTNQAAGPTGPPTQ